MKRNKKPISLQTLILNKLFLYILVSILSLILFNLIIKEMYNTSIIKSNLYEPLNVDLENYEDISQEYLNDNHSSIEVIDKNLNIIYSEGFNKETKSKYTLLEFTDLLNNMDEYKNVYYSILQKDNGNEVTVVLIQHFNSNTLSKFNRLFRIYVITLIIGTFLIFLTAFLMFVRSIYRYIRKNFLFIQKNIEKTPYDKSRVDTSKINLLEAKNTIDCYNTMLDEMDSIKNEKDRLENQSRRLISNLSHDLKSPITTIKGYSEVLATEDLPVKEQKEYLSYINQSASDLNDLISLLFEQVKFQYCDYKLNLEQGDINNFLRDIAANYYMIFDKRGFNVNINIEETPHYINFDKVNIKRAFVNILENCLSHNTTPTNVEIESLTKKNKYIIRFKDNGIGISEEFKDNIFEPFYQGDSSRSTNHSGLGLYVTKQILEKHNATIIVTSDENFKTIFEIKFF